MLLLLLFIVQLILFSGVWSYSALAGYCTRSLTIVVADAHVVAQLTASKQNESVQRFVLFSGSVKLSRNITPMAKMHMQCGEI